MNPPDPIYRWIFIYGPPAVGKTTVGKRLARRLHLPFYDLDDHIQDQTGMNIPAIFKAHGEQNFRQQERLILEGILQRPVGVVALGGGALLNAETRLLVEATGTVLCLQASQDILLRRLQAAPPLRPLLAGNPKERLPQLLLERRSHYASFLKQLDTDRLRLPQSAWEAQIILGRFYVSGMGQGYPVIVQRGSLAAVASLFEQFHLRGPIAIASDENVARLYAQQLQEHLESAGYPVRRAQFPPGESAKNLASLQALWQAFLEGGLERRSTVLALGGGVTSDLAGFAASVYLRGVDWAALPTSLLGMVDASLGGKTAINLPQGKNLIGSFYPSRFVLIDPDTLSSLPEAELRSGLAEIVKAGVIGDARLFGLCAMGWQNAISHMEELINRAITVKIRLVQSDPYERGRRAALNLGHTIGHALEQASHYQLSHGQAVSIGMVAEARLAEEIGLAQTGLTNEIEAVLVSLGLPVQVPHDLDRSAILAALRLDKKRQDQQVHFALPLKIGHVRTGVVIHDNDAILRAIGG